jgi:hypothetical protein
MFTLEMFLSWIETIKEFFFENSIPVERDENLYNNKPATVGTQEKIFSGLHVVIFKSFSLYFVFRVLFILLNVSNNTDDNNNHCDGND